MIFVTVGTHEQPFNRLIEKVDLLKKNGDILDDVFIQSGFSTYEPEFCKYKSIIPFEKMNQYITDSALVITHGGPASFMKVLEKGKIPIVVPRQKKYGEHVNNHQLEFCQKVQDKMGNIIVLEDIDMLKSTINNFSEISLELKKRTAGTNESFVSSFSEIVKNLVGINK